MELKRRKPTNNERVLLYAEVDGMCPLCMKPLKEKKASSLRIKFDAAHIYPLNPTQDEKDLLASESKITDDVNDLSNFIALCKNCHDRFDNPRTVDEYKRLFNLKKKIIERDNGRSEYHNYMLENEIRKILKIIGSQDLKSENLDLSLNPLKIEDKNDGTLSLLTIRKIKNDIIEYFPRIQEIFKELGYDMDYTFISIATQIRSYYMKLKKEGINQEDIYYNIIEWIQKRTLESSVEACSILVSFFVQNCEVYDDCSK